MKFRRLIGSILHCMTECRKRQSQIQKMSTNHKDKYQNTKSLWRQISGENVDVNIAQK